MGLPCSRHKSGYEIEQASQRTRMHMAKCQRVTDTSAWTIQRGGLLEVLAPAYVKAR